MGYRQTVIYDRNGWRLTSYGNGAAYLLQDTIGRASVFLQGDDADRFRADVFGAAIQEDAFDAYSLAMTPDDDAKEGE